MNDLLLSYYGDDLTGSTDALEALACQGVPSVLFTARPSAEQRARFDHCRALGLAGTSRSESNDWMRRELKRSFQWLAEQGAALTHYKTCSTFDSSPEVGSIGCAMEVARGVFGETPIPLVVGVPQMRRYTVFGELYAAYQDQIYRIDRHPVMSRHPVTPMHEADLRRHLAAQTTLPVGLIDVPSLALPDIDERVDHALAEHPAVLFDVLEPAHQQAVGHQLWRTRPQQQGGKGGFVAGSSGVEYALLAEWQRLGLVEGGEDFTPPSSVERIAVVSGSVSSTTARQIHWAVEHAGFQRIELDPRSLAIPAHRNEAMATAILKALDALSSGRSVILHTAMGPDSHDDSLATESSRHSLGKALGEMLKALVDDQGLTRVCVAGGDTSSHAITALNIHALTVKMPLPDTPGSPLCQAHSDDPRYQDLEIAFKGGQIGGDDYFERLRRGRALADHEH
ncbi:four-carbon acid sugar kinase family protein [Halomonas sp. DN3]|uniref:four-carbon acid sugar kinase family protein n=1 Tax=Halomonas sp. DN3 TaxID=2953657 RepID=UPI0020A1D7A7|nr:four-carbon acid sugar kinase family protein [Halomonas sp. DN3]USZ50542.1 four-carbon acid sugar kinase family protein [Halomonas sp. DN3]